MKEFDILNALNDVEDTYLLEAQLPASETKKRKPIWRRPVLIAACLCLVLAGVVAAAKGGIIVKFYTGTEWSDLFADPPEEPVAGGVSVTTLIRVPMDSLTDELKRVSEEQGPGPALYAFDSWDAMEEYIGLEIAENPVLDEAEKGLRRMQIDDHYMGDSHGVLMVLNNPEGELFCIFMDTEYMFENDVAVQANATIVTELNPYDNGGGKGSSFNDEQMEHMFTEEYLMSNGEMATIIGYPLKVEDVEASVMHYNAYFSSGYAMMEISAYVKNMDITWTEEEKAAIDQNTLATLKRVLDGFQ